MKPSYSKVIVCLVSSLIYIFSFSAQAFSHLNTKDDCVFIREQIKNLPSSGGEVMVPAGIYTCDSPIVLDQSNTSLRGVGDVTIRLGNKANSPLIIMGDIETPPRAIRNVGVYHLKLDGNRLNQQSECWGGACDGGGVTVIRNNGITVRGITRGHIKDVFITSARSGGIVTEKGCFDLEVDQLTSIDNHFDGFAGYVTSGSKISNLDLSHNLAAGISLDIQFNGNHFKNVRIANNGDVGIFMRDSSSNIFENFSISDSGSHGIFMSVVDDDNQASCPIDNEFQNLAVLRSKGVGFRLNDACVGNKLTGLAQFIGNRDECVSEGPGAILEILGQITCQK